MKNRIVVRLLAVVALLIGTLTAVVSSASSASAFSGCTAYGGNGSQFGGSRAATVNNAYEGAYALLTYRNSDEFCHGGTTDGASSWVMVASSSNTTLGWAQTGFYEDTTRGEVHFAQSEEDVAAGANNCQTSNSICTTVYGSHVCGANVGYCWGASNLAESHWQYVYWQPYHEVLQIDSTVFIVTSWNPLGFGVWQTPLVVNVANEARYRGTDIPGDDNDRSYFTNINFQNYNSNGWEGACGNGTFANVGSNAPDNNYQSVIVNCQEVDNYVNPAYPF